MLRPRPRGSLDPLLDMGVLRRPLHVDCIMGVVGGVPPGARNLAAMVANIPGVDGAGPPIALGGDRHQPPAVGAGRRRRSPSAARCAWAWRTTSTSRDGEMARSNGELVAKARQMTEDVGRRPATVQEARRLLNVPQRDA